MKKNILMLTLISIVILMLSSCASGPPKIQYWPYKEYQLTTDQVQTKNGMTIELEPLTPTNTYKHPELFAFDWDDIPEAFSSGIGVKSMFPPGPQGKSWQYTFGFDKNFLVAFKVNITNNTDHILRMSDSRIYLRIEGEEPIAAVTKFGDATPLKDEKGGVINIKSAYEGDGSLIHWITYYEKLWDDTRKKGLISLAYPVGITSQVINSNKKNYRLINAFDKEILPGDSYSGILLFPALISWDKVNVKFYDIITKTDPAGNPLEKTTFDFECKYNEKQLWYDREAKEWKGGKILSQTKKRRGIFPRSLYSLKIIQNLLLKIADFLSGVKRSRINECKTYRWYHFAVDRNNTHYYFSNCVICRTSPHLVWNSRLHN